MKILLVIVFILAILGGVAFLILKAKDKKKDDCSDGSCDKPVDPCADGSCDKPVEPVKPVEPLSIKLTLVPNNEGTNVPEGVFCTRTKSIKAVETITGNDCGDCVVRQWFDNNTEKIDYKGKIEIPPPFYTGHIIKYKATIGDVSQETSVKIV